MTGAEIRISTNTLLTEGDVILVDIDDQDTSISTNTLLTEGDACSVRLPNRPTIYFNQHPPHGG